MIKAKKIFITGTDTDVGKTLLTTCLITLLQNKKKSVVALKPIAAGCEIVNGELKNLDALLIQTVMDKEMEYHKVNPILLEKPMAPHLAARLENKKLSVKQLQQSCDMQQYSSDYLLIEGAGGWLVPLNEKESYADFVIAEQCDVILVVGIKLGCINHALLSLKNIQSSGLNVIGWVANCIEPNMLAIKENIETLTELINVPRIAKIPFIKEEGDFFNLTQAAIEYVNITPILR